MAERRLERDRVLRCPKCGGEPYLIYRRQLAQRDGTLLPSYESVLWPAHPDVPPPRDPADLRCPADGEALRSA
jgi:hypothetical protein